MNNLGLYFQIARERYLMLQRKEANERLANGGWTLDEVLGNYRFCNVFREDDKVTRWYRENIAKPLGNNHLAQVRAAVVFRWLNKIESGELLKDLLLGEWSTGEARRRLQVRQMEGQTILGAAYMIKSPPGKTKATGIMECYAKVEDELEAITSDALAGQSLQHLHSRLCTFDYIGPFMAYQMVCDLRYTPLFAKCRDAMTWTAPGPGSARGISRLLYGTPKGLKYSSPKDQERLITEMRHILRIANGDSFEWPADWPRWELATVQHWACEFDKYCRTYNGEGRPKQTYTAS